ncbi:hypothetical protein AYO20_10448 [Fonsecaea nubica]|uniref:Aminoglycoside phosphotransferase domain-containing protein n=1 Tax=Fonsecaea nubica TaxID=856822 RepID=A0A178C7L0_9EURO|nr:hypothetical protein AYO20_10448 [Fonsecaea nubica]OAL25414.1 hypothetical protein AYO20_10448 [Fonsecaea nubica]
MRPYQDEPDEIVKKRGFRNVCIPVYFSPASKKDDVYVRIPLPYKVGERNSPGNVEEKLRCEVASYIWIQQNCPDIPIPALYGFGFPDGQTFTAPENVPRFTRLLSYVKRTLFLWLDTATPSRYIRRRRLDILKTGYIIIGRVIEGEMLSISWDSFRHDAVRRSNLFHDIARITLSLNKARLPRIGSLSFNDSGHLTLSLNKARLPRIGSLSFNDSGHLTLTNRPLTLRLQTLENEGIPTPLDRNSTYTAVEPYVLDLLACHDHRIHHQPNSIHHHDDGEQQLAALTMMRAIIHHFLDPTYRHGPFVFTLTDLHQSNIFVDKDWHITSLIDLEWACSLPIEFQSLPYWLSGLAVDELTGEHLDTFRRLATEYLDAFEQEERRILGTNLFQTPIMRKGWETGSFCRCDKAKIDDETAYKHRLEEAFADKLNNLGTQHRK